MPPKEEKIVPVEALSAARLDEYFDTWNIDETRGGSLEQAIRGCDWSAHLREFAVKQQAKQAAGDVGGRLGYSLQGGVAVIELNGTLMKQESSFGGTSTVAAKRAIGLAMRDPNVGGIALLIDSPGGTAAGTGDLAEAVAEAAKLKPTWAYCADCCCSAAYYVASQADKILANGGATIGSIGTYMVVRDTSGMHAAAGIKTHVVRAGKHKGVGTPGTEITAEQLTDLQRHVDAVNAQFVAAVQSGRKLTAEQATELADGRVYVGAEAQKLKLIDGVQSWDRTLADLQKLVQQKTKGKSMDPNQNADTKPKAATIGELRQACPGAGDSFVLAQLEKNATVNEAMTAYITEQRTQLEASKQEMTKANAVIEEAKKNHTAQKKPGVSTLQDVDGKKPSQEGATGDAASQWRTAIKELMAESGCTKAEALSRLARTEPGMHAAYLNELNSKVGRPANFKAV